MSDVAASLEQIYRQRSQETQHIWQENPEQKTHSGFYPENLSAIATGIQPALNPQISELLAELGQLSQGDPLADVMHPDHFHLTFLAITPALYNNHRQPEAVSGLRKIAEKYLHQTLRVRDLRLVALPNQLLIAGIPDAENSVQRTAFWRELQDSDWAGLLQQRYGGKEPPLFWHSTILRYNATVLPDRLQRFFAQRSEQRYGEMTGKIVLRLVSYNWSSTQELA